MNKAALKKRMEALELYLDWNPFAGLSEEELEAYNLANKHALFFCAAQIRRNMKRSDYEQTAFTAKVLARVEEIEDSWRRVSLLYDRFLYASRQQEAQKAAADSFGALRLAVVGEE